MSFDAFDLTEYFELMENFKQQNEEEVIRVWGSVENYERLINKVKADEQRVGELAVKYYGSTENYTRGFNPGCKIRRGTGHCQGTDGAYAGTGE